VLTDEGKRKEGIAYEMELAKLSGFDSEGSLLSCSRVLALFSSVLAVCNAQVFRLCVHLYFLIFGRMHVGEQIEAFLPSF
jgi:hypothetical protein